MHTDMIWEWSNLFYHSLCHKYIIHYLLQHPSNHWTSILSKLGKLLQKRYHFILQNGIIERPFFPFLAWYTISVGTRLPGPQLTTSGPCSEIHPLVFSFTWCWEVSLYRNSNSWKSLQYTMITFYNLPMGMILAET